MPCIALARARRRTTRAFVCARAFASTREKHAKNARENARCLGRAGRGLVADAEGAVGGGGGAVEWGVVGGAAGLRLAAGLGGLVG